jgi:hypothetical protein
MVHTLDLVALEAGEDERILTPEHVGGSGNDWKVTMRRLRGGLSEGVVTLDVTHGDLRYVVIPTRGFGLWKAWHRGEEFGWQSPVRGPVHPQFVNLGEPSGLGWLDGFDELLVRCGWESNGAPEYDAASGRLVYPLHGRIANKPAHAASLTYDDTTGQLSLTGIVEETRFHFTKLRMRSTIATTKGARRLVIADEIENFSASPTAVQMLYHVNFGRPLLDGGSQLVAPVERLVPRNAHAAANVASWPTYAPPVPGFAEEVYFMSLYGNAAGQSHVLLKNAAGTHGVSLLFPLQQLPCFTQWKNTTAVADGYVTGLEPGTNFPNPRSFEAEHGRVVPLGPGERAPFTLTLELHTQSAEVQAAEQQVLEIQADRPTQCFDQPQPTWCS